VEAWAPTASRTARGPALERVNVHCYGWVCRLMLLNYGHHRGMSVCCLTGPAEVAGLSCRKSCTLARLRELCPDLAPQKEFHTA
jgi:hypothetical protein